MTTEAFNKIKLLNPMIGELCEKLDLDLDLEYYNHPDRVREAKHKKAIDLAKDVFLKIPYLPKDLVYHTLLLQYKEDGVNAILKYWIDSKIVENDSDGYLILNSAIAKETIEKKTLFANEFLGKIGYIPKDDLGKVFESLGLNAEKEIAYWLKNKIVNIGYAVFGTSRQTRKEIVFLSDCPF